MALSSCGWHWGDPWVALGGPLGGTEDPLVALRTHWWHWGAVGATEGLWVALRTHWCH